MINNLETLLNDYKSTLDSVVKSLIELHERDTAAKGRLGKWLQAASRKL
jgi:hypothetical protein